MVFRRVLVTTDLSEAAGHAARTGRALAAKDAVGRVFSVASRPLPPTALAEWGFTDLENAHLQARTFADERARALADELGFARADARVEEGSVARAVAAEAREWDADLVTVGGRVESGIERLLFGARGRAILRGVQCPVLVGRGRVERFTRIAVATDFGASSERAAELAWRVRERVPAAESAELLLVHAVDPSLGGDLLVSPEAADAEGYGHAGERMGDAADRMLEQFNEKTLHGRGRVHRLDGAPMKVMPQFLRDNSVDLLVVGTHGPGVIERTLLGSVAEGLASEAPCPVLVVRNGHA